MRLNEAGESLRVFMLGWEFPPFISGGLGTACYGLTKAMNQLGIHVTFVLPKVVDEQYATHVNLLNPNSYNVPPSLRINELQNVEFHTLDSPLEPYTTPDTYQQRIEETIRRKQLLHGGACGSQFFVKSDYGNDMYSEVHRYAALCVELAKQQDIDIVHAHDWMTYPAGIAVAAITGKPLVVHVHSTEFDRSGEHVNQMIYDIERQGMTRADKIIAVSHFTRSIIISRYGISGDKVEVVHNGVDRNGTTDWTLEDAGIRNDEKIVLFLGRITMQKGPEYFLYAARKVLEVMPNVKFVMAGSGDMMHRTIELAAELGIGHKVLFTGFLRGPDVQKIYKMADLYVMPSVSEPFGIAPLEALDHDVPVIISKQSGVSEVLIHALKVDFWDVDEIANKVVAVLKYPPLEMTLKSHGSFEVRKLRWKDSARKCAKIYEEMLVPV
ncbi:MAG: glycosyltransferase family 4 protein [Sedimentisphaerales bacterium]|nr:glycosyltransferase family 4 protein [Sedimentisphaerales bacterium]